MSNPRTVETKKSTSSRVISQEELTQYMHLPEKVVAKELGICLTSLKKLCRQYGILRWPHRKIKAIDKKLTSLHTAKGGADDEETVVLKGKVDVLKNERRGGGTLTLRPSSTSTPDAAEDDSSCDETDSETSRSGVSPCVHTNGAKPQPNAAAAAAAAAAASRVAAKQDPPRRAPARQPPPATAGAAAGRPAAAAAAAAAFVGAAHDKAARPPRPVTHVIPMPDLAGRAHDGAGGSVKLDLTLPADVADLVARGLVTIKIVQNPGQVPELHLTSVVDTDAAAEGAAAAADGDHDEAAAAAAAAAADWYGGGGGGGEEDGAHGMDDDGHGPPGHDDGGGGLLEAKDLEDPHVYNSLFSLDGDAGDDAPAPAAAASAAAHHGGGGGGCDNPHQRPWPGGHGGFALSNLSAGEEGNDCAQPPPVSDRDRADILAAHAAGGHNGHNGHSGRDAPPPQVRSLSEIAAAGPPPSQPSSCGLLPPLRRGSSDGGLLSESCDDKMLCHHDSDDITDWFPVHEDAGRNGHADHAGSAAAAGGGDGGCCDGFPHQAAGGGTAAAWEAATDGAGIGNGVIEDTDIIRALSQRL